MSRENSFDEQSWSNELMGPMCTFDEGLENISVDMEQEVECESHNEALECQHEEDQLLEIEGEFGFEESSSEGSDDVENESFITISTLHDIASLDLTNLSPYDARNFLFTSLDMAFNFYYWFTRVNGFGARKSKILKNSKGEILQQTFVCYRQGFKEDRGLTMENRKRDVKPETRCGCEAMFRVHVDMILKLWYITYFIDEHNHEVLSDTHCKMLASHRSMIDVDVMQLNNMRNVGIGTPHIYGLLVKQYGGHNRVGFRRKDLYNQIGRQRKLKNVDGKSALQYLKGVGKKDLMIFFQHTVDEENRLEHLFWCDGIMQMDYKIFGDVLTFDATYGKNKYECPIVIFSGVNHHNQTIVFGFAVVANETEETYVWLLEQFLEAMKGKHPASVITDGDVAIKNSIKRVFPNAHHRLCAWHLLRNATANIANPAFTREFRKCMLGDYEVGEFKRKWADLISKFELEQHQWVIELYEKRRMWCTAYMKGSFFGGFRTTSRCEALHSQIAKFVYPRYNVTELLQHFNRCLNYMRYREVEADFEIIHGEPVLRTHFRKLERHAANVFTKEIFKLFRPILDRSGTIRVVGCKESIDCLIYTMSKCVRSERLWQVSFNSSKQELKCSCQRMELIGLPCDHILWLLVYLNIPELPKCLVLKRWTKSTKEDVRTETNSTNFLGSERDARYLSLMEHFKDISVLTAESNVEYADQRKKAINEWNDLMAKKVVDSGGNGGGTEPLFVNVRDPGTVRSKGGGSHKSRTSSGFGQPNTSRKCSSCRRPGHNRRRCPRLVNSVLFDENSREYEFQTEDEANNISSEYGDELEYVDDQSKIGVECHSFQASTYNSVHDSYMQP